MNERVMITSTIKSTSTSKNKKQWSEYGSAIVHGLNFINKGK